MGRGENTLMQHFFFYIYNEKDWCVCLLPMAGERMAHKHPHECILSNYNTIHQYFLLQSWTGGEILYFDRRRNPHNCVFLVTNIDMSIAGIKQAVIKQQNCSPRCVRHTTTLHKNQEFHNHSKTHTHAYTCRTCREAGLKCFVFTTQQQHQQQFTPVRKYDYKIKRGLVREAPVAIGNHYQSPRLFLKPPPYIAYLESSQLQTSKTKTVKNRCERHPDTSRIYVAR